MSQYISITELSAFNYPRYTILAVAIKAYCDGSGRIGDPNSRFLTLASYIGTPIAWQYFEEQWVRVLEKHNCAYLHMKEAFRLKGEFAPERGWTLSKVKALLVDIVNQCFSPAGWEKFKNDFRGASCTINLEDYTRACKDKPLLSSKKPEAICLDHIVTIALMMLPENLNKPFGKDGTVELYFDENEDFMCKLHKAWRKRKNKINDYMRLVSSIGSVSMHDVIGVQAADFLAWETNRYHTSGMKKTSGAMAAMFRVFSTPLASDEYYDYKRLMEMSISR